MAYWKIYSDSKGHETIQTSKIQTHIKSSQLEIPTNFRRHRFIVIS
jgi:hypothetical protein